jgi:indole-3-glycerol phosphate synthase
MSDAPATILDQILATTRIEVGRRRDFVSQATLEREAARAPAPRDFAAALAHKPGRASIACIAEVKRRSPSAGWIREGADAADVARGYEAAGAAAISVLTDQPFFGGSLDDLRAVRAAVSVPVLRKDFTVDAYQIFEARAAGADAILLIVAALGDAELRDFSACAHALGMAALVEAHTEEEVTRALDTGAILLGINHRDLRTFTVDTTLATRMRPRVPAGTLMVAESGIRTRDDVARLTLGGVHAMLVGETLMRAPHPSDALRALLA